VVDPGNHVLRLERAGSRPAEKRVTIEEGRKLQRVEVTLEPIAAGPAAPTSGPPPVPVLTIVFGAIGVAALAGSAYFEISGNADYRHLRDTCGVTESCAAGDIDSARTRVRVGDVLLGVAVLSLGVAAWQYLARPSAHHSARTSSM
jgi:hypothetical protein